MTREVVMSSVWRTLSVQEKEIEWQGKMQQHMGSIPTMRP